MSFLYDFLSTLNSFLWNGPLLFLLLGIHLLLTLRLRFVQRKLPAALRLSVGGDKKHAFRSLTTALAATLGTGNIVGVSSAIALGGPGAVFWCWLTGILGMATAYGECYLCMLHRKPDESGTLRGGTMYVLEHALKNKKAGRLFAYLLLIASFGIGCSTQAGTVTETVSALADISPELTGLFLVLAVGYVILHGSKAITKFCSVLVPLMAILYLLACLILLAMNAPYIGPALRLILTSAFSPTAALGGIAGGSFLLSARYGIARGLFTNEAGIGTAPLAFTENKESSPEKAALLSMSAVFWDTVILCALTGLVIISSLLREPSLAEHYTATTLASAAFSLLPYGELLLGISLIAFAYATLIGWSYFGAQAVTYLFGESSLTVYRLCYLCMIFLGSVLSLPLIWELTDFINACMVLPNVLALFLLRKTVKAPTS
ncbi:MAG: sodium:alanine symporter family protein [Lachnospiraceae bacterium]|nr:sodium:alanine symporter family protein [Lachnospiraceae bacterium]